MSRRQFNYFLYPLAVLAVLLISSSLMAQVNTELVKKNREAMDAYANLEIETALNLLQDAEDYCKDNNITGPELARVFVNRGVVEMGGNGDNSRAMEYFMKGLCQDSAVMLDPLNSTPEMTEIFKAAQSRTSSQGCEGIGPPLGGESSEPTVDDMLSSSSSSENTLEISAPAAGTSVEISNNVLRHTSVAQQASLLPIPFYVTTNSDLDVASVVVFYRTNGERIFQQLPLARKKDDGWAAYIDCDVLTTFNPSEIEYYIAVTDSSGQLLSTAGTEAQPITITIGGTVTQPPPVIPDEAPLPACQEDCPPWNPGCNDRNCKKYAELCSDDDPCCSGMTCVNGVCEEAGGKIDNSPRSANTRVRFYLNGGIGLGVVPKESYSSEDFPNMRNDETVESSQPGIGFSKFHIRVGAMVALTEKLEVGANFRGDMPLFSEYYDALVPSVLANVGYRIAGTNSEKGFQLFAIAGFGWVQIMHRVPFKDCLVYVVSEDGEGVECSEPEEDLKDDIPWQENPNALTETSGFRRAGYLGVEFGLDMNYWFARNVGLNVGTIFDITFPENVTLNLDVQLGLAFRF